MNFLKFVYKFFVKKSFSYNFPLFDQFPVPNIYVKKHDLARYSTSMLKYVKIQKESFLFNLNHVNKGPEFNEFIGSFNYEQVSKSDDNQSKWITKFKNLYFNCLKTSNLSIESRYSNHHLIVSKKSKNNVKILKQWQPL